MRWYNFCFNINNFFRYKFVVAEALVEHFNPIRLKVQDYLKNPDYLHDVLEKGTEKAREVAEKTMNEVKSKVGLGNLNFASRQNRMAEKNWIDLSWMKIK